jgi:hypothetical protein
LNPTCVRTPAASAASAISRASAAVGASGFSQWTCLPWAMAKSAISLWSALGAVTWTTSIPGSAARARQSSVARAKPSAAAAPSAAPRLASASMASSTRNGRSKTFSAAASPKAWARPMKPDPISPTRSAGLAIPVPPLSGLQGPLARGAA